jgi:hypothetical protein
MENKGLRMKAVECFDVIYYKYVPAYDRLILTACRTIINVRSISPIDFDEYLDGRSAIYGYVYALLRKV